MWQPILGLWAAVVRLGDGVSLQTRYTTEIQRVTQLRDAAKAQQAGAKDEPAAVAQIQAKLSPDTLAAFQSTADQVKLTEARNLLAAGKLTEAAALIEEVSSHRLGELKKKLELLKDPDQAEKAARQAGAVRGKANELHEDLEGHLGQLKGKLDELIGKPPKQKLTDEEAGRIRKALASDNPTALLKTLQAIQKSHPELAGEVKGILDNKMDRGWFRTDYSLANLAQTLANADGAEAMADGYRAARQEQLKELPQEDLLKRFKDLDCGWTTDAEYAEMRQLAALADPETRAKMIKQLMSGYTSGDAEACLRDILKDARGPETNPPSADFKALMARIDKSDLYSELDGDKLRDAKRWVAQAASNPYELKDLVGDARSDAGIRNALVANPNAPPSALRDLADRQKTPSTDAATQLLIATNPHAPVEVLQQLQRDGLSEAVKAQAATELKSRARTTDDAGQLRHLAETSRDPAILKDVADNRDAPPDVLRALADPKRTPATNADVQYQVALNRNTPVEVLQQLRGSGLSDMVKTTAANKLADRARWSEDADELRKLAGSKDPAVLKQLAVNKHTPVEVLVKLAAGSKDSDVLKAVAGNPSTPITTLRQLRDGGPSDEVKRAASDGMTERAQHGERPEDLRALLKDAAMPGLCIALATNPKCPPDVLLALCDPAKVPQTDITAQEAVLANPGVTRAALQKLEKDGLSDEIKGKAKAALADLAAAADPKTPADRLGLLAAGSPSRELQQALAANPTTPNETFARLVVRDQEIGPDEIQALRKRAAGQTEAQVKDLLEAAGLADGAAGKLAGWLKKGDEDFKRIFAVGGAFPVTVALQPGIGGLNLVRSGNVTDAVKPHSVAPNVSLDSQRAPTKVSEPRAGTFKFDGGGKVETLTYTVEIRGHKIDVIYPKYGTAAGVLPSLDQVVKGLALLPEAELTLIERVAMNPEKNPQDKYWAVEYEDPDFESFATGGGKTINFFPSSDPNPQSEIDSTMLHEFGHNLSDKLGNIFRDYDESGEWEAAMKADGERPSEYAENSNGEDFAESVALYFMGRNDPAMRARFGHRFAVLDKIFAKKK